LFFWLCMVCYYHCRWLYHGMDSTMSDTFHANDYNQAAKRTDGTSAPGNVIRAVVRVGHNLWKIANLPADDLTVNYDHEGGVSWSERWENIKENWGLK